MTAYSERAWWGRNRIGTRQTEQQVEEGKQEIHRSRSGKRTNARHTRDGPPATPLVTGAPTVSQPSYTGWPWPAAYIMVTGASTAYTFTFSQDPGPHQDRWHARPDAMMPVSRVTDTCS
jgi:hypothetical protein